MSGGSSDPLRALICGGSPGKFAQPTEGWQACCNDDILAAAAKQLGVLQQRRPVGSQPLGRCGALGFFFSGSSQ